MTSRMHNPWMNYREIKYVECGVSVGSYISNINVMKWFIGSRIKYIITNTKIKPNDNDGC